MKNENSRKIFKRASEIMPGGVSSPVRAFKSVKCDPIVVKRGEGAYIYDVDDNKYLDMISSWGPLILGHACPEVIETAFAAMKNGSSYGVTSELEVQLAELIQTHFPGMEKMRFVSSGTEATMSAVRLARGFTGKDKIVKFEGCYHGHADFFLIKAGSGALTFGAPDSKGVTRNTAADTLLAPYNDLVAFRNIIEQNKNQVAAVIVEPVAGNIGVVLPEEGYLKGLESMCRENKILLIFDEIITGFRVSMGGAQAYYGIKPDITTLGKIIGGGFPIAAYGGRREIMAHLSPEGEVYQAGTLSGNPVAVASGLATLKKLADPETQATLKENSEKFIAGMKENVSSLGLKEKLTLNYLSSMFTLFFTGKRVTDLTSAKFSDTALYASYFKEMLENGILLAPSQFEACFVSAAQSDKDIDFFLSVQKSVLNKLFK